MGNEDVFQGHPIQLGFPVGNEIGHGSIVKPQLNNRRNGKFFSLKILIVIDDLYDNIFSDKRII